MKTLDPRQAARGAVAATPARAANALIHDSDDARLVVFRIEPGQAVAPHRSPSTVVLSVLEGTALLTGDENGESCESTHVAGSAVVYAPGELHGMRAEQDTVLLLATITPRPGSR